MKIEGKIEERIENLGPQCVCVLMIRVGGNLEEHVGNLILRSRFFMDMHYLLVLWTGFQLKMLEIHAPQYWGCKVAEFDRHSG